MAERNDHPLTLVQLERLSPEDRAQLRERFTSRWVCNHPEVTTVVLALLDHLELGHLEEPARLAYQKWQDYYGRTETTDGT